MQIHIICTKEELKKTDEIQEALGRAMKPLTDLGFKGEISIEEAQNASTMLQSQLTTFRLVVQARNGWYSVGYLFRGCKSEQVVRPLIRDGILFCDYLIHSFDDSVAKTVKELLLGYETGKKPTLSEAEAIQTFFAYRSMIH